MCWYECAWMNVLVWMCLNECTCMNVLIWVYLYECTDMSVLVWVCLYECACISVLVWVCLCECACMNVLIWVYLYECIDMSVLIWVYLYECTCMSVLTNIFLRNERQRSYALSPNTNVDQKNSLCLEFSVSKPWRDAGEGVQFSESPTLGTKCTCLYSPALVIFFISWKFLGPPADAMWALGDKIASSIVAQSLDIPTLQWSGSGRSNISCCADVISFTLANLEKKWTSADPSDLLSRGDGRLSSNYNFKMKFEPLRWTPFSIYNCSIGEPFASLTRIWKVNSVWPSRQLRRHIGTFQLEKKKHVCITG